MIICLRSLKVSIITILVKPLVDAINAVDICLENEIKILNLEKFLMSIVTKSKRDK